MRCGLSTELGNDKMFDTNLTFLGAVPLVTMGVLGFLAKRAFNDLHESMTRLSGKLDVLQNMMHTNHTEIAVLQTRVQIMELKVQRLEGAA